MSDAPEMEITPERPSFWRNLSLVWLVPVLAIAVSVGIAWRSYSDRGVLVEITFQNAAGVTAGETAVRLRDVPIGVVESVDFTPDLSHVVVSARIARNVAANLPESAEFWVVRPEVSARGISGLSTVLSGVYIEAAFLPDPEASARVFTGLDRAPLVSPGRAGSRITLRAPDGNRLTPGAPVLYRGIQVGHIEEPRLLDGAEGVVFDAFIDAPHDARLTTATRFWDTSGFSVSFGAGGLNLNVGNLASILTGGIAFDTVFAGGTALRPETVFELYRDEATARQSVVAGVGANSLRMTVEFDGSLQGLSSGAMVRYRGIRVGTVNAISARIADGPSGPHVVMQAAISLNPQSMGLPDDQGPAELADFMELQVAAGLRAQLAVANLFGRSLVIDLVEHPEAEPATMVRTEGGIPILPSVTVELPDFNASAEGLLARINKLPVEAVMEQAISLMATTEALIGQESTRAAPGAAVALLDEARALIGSDEVKAIPTEVGAAVADLRKILQGLEEQKAVERLVAALTAAEEAANTVTEVSDMVPPLVEDLRAVAAKAQGMEVDQLIASATKLMDSTEVFIASDGMKTLPPALSGALDEVKLALTELREGGVVPNVNRTLQSAGNAADAIAEATKDLPQLAARLEGLVGQAEALVAAYGARSPVNDEMLNTLREARNAARAFSQLARALERNPNSLLFGR